MQWLLCMTFKRKHDFYLQSIKFSSSFPMLHCFASLFVLLLFFSPFVATSSSVSLFLFPGANTRSQLRVLALWGQQSMRERRRVCGGVGPEAFPVGLPLSLSPRLRRPPLRNQRGRVRLQSLHSRLLLRRWEAGPPRRRALIAPTPDGGDPACMRACRQWACQLRFGSLTALTGDFSIGSLLWLIRVMLWKWSCSIWCEGPRHLPAGGGLISSLTWL